MPRLVAHLLRNSLTIYPVFLLQSSQDYSTTFSPAFSSSLRSTLDTSVYGSLLSSSNSYFFYHSTLLSASIPLPRNDIRP